MDIIKLAYIDIKNTQIGKIKYMLS